MSRHADAGRGYATALQAMPSSTDLHGFRPPGGGMTTLPDDGVLVDRGVQDSLGVVHAGDQVTLTLPLLGHTVQAQIAGFRDEPLGTFAYGSLTWLNRAVGPVTATSALLRYAPEADRSALRRTLTALLGVAAYRTARPWPASTTSTSACSTHSSAACSF
ncbi:hypothetical protein AB4Z38_12055 [Arthrobacter sp. 2RAF6]|uniref:hypothetical protein n=1 Tax=Arthrobacter sp. 2RAF6 TaxID=3233002 RepID=UPI003F90AE7D